MIPFEEIKKYLPQYLSSKSQRELLKDLEQFPQNIDKRFYSQQHLSRENFLQGDGIQDVLCVHLPSAEVRQAPVVLLSNSCDMAPENDRLAPVNAIYAPIFDLKKYKNALEKSPAVALANMQERVAAHIENIKKQKVSHIFYLPKTEKLDYEAIVFFDRINHISSSEIYKNPVTEKRIFSLGNLGHYIFLIKLSIHFTRIREEIDRSFAA